MEDAWKKIINYRNIAHMSLGIITVLLVLSILVLFGRLALDSLRVYAYWIGFAATTVSLVIMQISWEIMKLAEQEWKGSLEEISEET